MSEYNSACDRDIDNHSAFEFVNLYTVYSGKVAPTLLEYDEGLSLLMYTLEANYKCIGQNHMTSQSSTSSNVHLDFSMYPLNVYIASLFVITSRTICLLI